MYVHSRGREKNRKTKSYEDEKRFHKILNKEKEDNQRRKEHTERMKKRENSDRKRKRKDRREKHTSPSTSKKQ